MSGWHEQRPFAVRMDWGLAGAQAIGRGADFSVVVAVLSFTTAVAVAAEAGAEVFPYPWKDDSAHEFARQHDAVLAVGRSQAAAAAGQGLVSLSPVSIRAAAGLSRLVLPSPNGSALASQLAGRGSAVVAGCLRNRTAVACWLAGQRGTGAAAPVIAVIAAGERWPDGSLRPAAEDLWGAGAIVSALAGQGVSGLSPEAAAAAAAFSAVRPALGSALLSCASGSELADIGFAADVAVAAELDLSDCVPVLFDGRFTDVARAT
jgi:2-phosphosulfolactate phosphatase